MKLEKSDQLLKAALHVLNMIPRRTVRGLAEQFECRDTYQLASAIDDYFKEKAAANDSGITV
jgi:hypothetical protein